ncbi:poly(u)-specific endoribonuclease-a [Phtheirospermum japonicum]|uniref:Poly(U)-specific endoribonuclease-a n=1 Tax=Phtheirospermum japonicum TaxID=374723 RepID=A0A830CKW7_9LAMI|nr:poly(u)-specific endoribonuclease-a [Phtheirospermum japonicum]
MEGLVKGLINVALDQIQGGDDRDDRDERSRPSRAQDDRDERDERSRSSWAQVVSGDGEDNDGSSSNTNFNNTKPWDSRQEQSYGRHERKSKESPRAEEDKNNDGWETVQKKPSKQQNKVHKEQWSNYKRPLSEQHYSSEVDCGAGIESSERELSDLSEALNRLWELDLNRLAPGKDYEIDCGEGKKVYQKDDMAAGSLFSWLSEEIFTRPTYSRFCSLLDNYNPHEGYKEVVTPQEKQEQAAFIEEISRTAPIKYLYKYLLAKGIASGSYEDFKRTMTSIWFDLYGRGGTSSCSSAFEHVFVGEIKRGEQQPDSETQLLTIQFEWNGVLKSVSSTLIGVSPEFEMAIYTLCYYVGGEDNHVQLGPYPVNIKCYRLGNKIGSAFPVADS